MVGENNLITLRMASTLVVFVKYDRQRILSPKQALTKAYFVAKNKSFHKKAIEMLETCRNDYISLKGNYGDE